jgi:hypothetical protein
MRQTTLKSRLWFCVILFLVLSFPIQVYRKSPYPALIPYLLIGLILLITTCSPRRGRPVGSNLPQNRNINFVVGVYVIHLLLNSLWQAGFGVISFNEGVTALVVYLLPVVCYFYFRSIATEGEIRAVLWAMSIAALIVGGYFVYDSYLKLSSGTISDYAQRAFEYTVERLNLTMEDANTGRISDVARSSGLLSSHSISASWIILGACATLTLIPRNRNVKRRVFTLIFGTMLLLGLNFTGIVAFSFIMFLFEFGGLSVLRGRISGIIGNVLPLTLTLAALLGVSFWAVGDVVSNRIVELFSHQTDFAFGTGEASTTLVGLLAGGTEHYLEHIARFPHTLLLGDGYGTTYGLEKGGDLGLIESLAKLGMPLFLIVGFGLLSLIKSGLLQVKTGSNGQATAEAGLDRSRVIQFAVCVTLLILISEAHYSVWQDKSVLPIVFFSLALYGRYLSVPPRNLSLQRKNRIQSAVGNNAP